MIKSQSRAVKLFTSSALAMALAHSISPALAQTAPSQQAITATQQTLSVLTQSAWQKQTDYLTRDSQLALIDAKAKIYKRSTPETGSVELGTNRASQGGRGYELAYTTPIWLRNERQLSTQQLLDESQGLDSKLAVSKWRIAGQVRELYWLWRISRNDVQYAVQHAENAAQLLGDVKKRLAAGDMTHADLKQAEIAQLSSQLALAEAQNSESTAREQLAAATGAAINDQTMNVTAVEAEEIDSVTSHEHHPMIANITLQMSQLDTTKQLAIVQSRARPEISVGVGRDKGGSGEQYRSNLRMGIKIPLAAASNNQLAQVTVQTRMDELRAEKVVEAQKLSTDQTIAQQRLKGMEQQIGLAQRRSDAADALLGMIQKAFIMGEFDLPTRIRTATEANEAKRQLAKASLEKAGAQSAYKQALGLLP